MKTGDFKMLTAAELAHQIVSDGNAAHRGPQPFRFVSIGVHSWFLTASLRLSQLLVVSSLFFPVLLLSAQDKADELLNQAQAAQRARRLGDALILAAQAVNASPKNP